MGCCLDVDCRPALRMVKTLGQAEPLEAAGATDELTDVVVVGAGPAGSATAMLLSQKGYRVKVELYCHA